MNDDTVGRDTPGGAERREHARTPADVPAQVRVAGLAPVTGHTINLSTHGALVTLASEVPLGLELTLVLDLPDGGAPLRVTALGVRQKRTGASVEVALCFIHPAAAAVERLSALVYTAP